MTPDKFVGRSELDVLLAHLVRSMQVLLIAVTKLKATDFDDMTETGHRLIWACAESFYKEHGRAIPLEILYAEIEKRARDYPQLGDPNLLQAVYNLAYDLFNLNEQQGLLFGNESPSVLKRTEIYVNEGKVQMGMGLHNEPFPFKKWLKPAEIFTSPKTFIYVSNSGKWQDAFEGKYQDFIRNYLGVKLYQQKNKPFFIYNTWQPFFDSINENIVKGCADNLSKIGTDLYIIDAGWYKRAGDFNVDTTKFPNGLKPICEYIRSKNMRVGLWFTIGSVHAKSEVAKQHPEWIIKDKNGKPANLHQSKYEEDGNVWDSAIRTMSMGSPYYDHIKNTIRDYVKDWGISYLKLDLSIANSAYVNNLDATGDYDLNNPCKLYKDRASSYWVIYERMMKLMDDIHAEFPDMLLDCTFEVWGRYNLVDYALIEHGDYDWLTNFDFKQPAGPISIRQMSYDRSRVVPTSTLLIGNQFIDSDNSPYVYFSMVSTSALMVGDSRKLSSKELDFYTKWNSWFKEIENKYQFSKYRQVYDIFDRPTDNNWDGNYRINTEKSGGLMFFFRNNSSDATRIFKVPCLNPDFTYRIYSHDDGKVVGSYKGSELINVGVSITIPTTYSAKVLLIEKESGN